MTTALRQRQMPSESRNFRYDDNLRILCTLFTEFRSLLDKETRRSAREVHAALSSKRRDGFEPMGEDATYLTKYVRALICRVRCRADGDPGIGMRLSRLGVPMCTRHMH